MTRIYEQNVPAGQEFVFKDGTKVHNIQELGEKISIIDDTEFHRYVNEEKNDFVNWLVYSLRNEELANIVGDVKSRPLMYLKIRQFILKSKNSSDIPPIQKHPFKEYDKKEQEQEYIEIQEVNPQEIPVRPVEDIQEEPQPTFTQRLKNKATAILPPKPPEVQQERVYNPPLQQQAPQYREQQAQEEELATDFIVKEFIYGVVCGVLIGLIVAKIIEILF